MKPDFDLVRAVLLALGNGEDSGRDFTCLDIPGRTQEDEDSWKRAEKKLGKRNSYLGALKQMLFDLVTSIFGL